MGLGEKVEVNHDDGGTVKWCTYGLVRMYVRVFLKLNRPLSTRRRSFTLYYITTALYTYLRCIESTNSNIILLICTGYRGNYQVFIFRRRAHEIYVQSYESYEHFSYLFVHVCVFSRPIALLLCITAVVMLCLFRQCRVDAVPI